MLRRIIERKMLFVLMTGILSVFTAFIAMASTDGTEEKTFREGFSIRTISDDLFERMKAGNTFKEDCIVPREDLRYLLVLHKDKEGNTHQGEMVVHKLIAEDVLEIFEKLYDAGYPIERMVLPDNYMADDETKSAAANGNEYGICVEL